MSIENILKASSFTFHNGFWGLPLLLWGEPGIGKSDLVEAFCKRWGLYAECLSPGERGEGQFGVVGVPAADGFLDYPSPRWAQNLTCGGMIFVDELNTAAPALQSSLLGLVRKRRLGTHVFGSHVRAIGAANSVQDAAGGWELAPAICNRFGHLSWEGLAAPDWVDAYLSNFAYGEVEVQDAKKEEARVMAAWPEADAAARGLIAAFISRRPGNLHRRPPEGAPAEVLRSWPSRRSVDYAGAVLASSRVHNLTESETDEFLAGFVGRAWVNEFATWRRDADLPDPAAVLDGRAKWEHSAARPDRTMAVLSACAALVTPKNADNRQARAEALWTLITGVVNAGSTDLAGPAARALVGNGLFTKSAFAVMPKFNSMFNLAGVGVGAA